jgi:hypothetical protein
MHQNKMHIELNLQVVTGVTGALHQRTSQPTYTVPIHVPNTPFVWYGASVVHYVHSGCFSSPQHLPFPESRCIFRYLETI